MKVVTTKLAKRVSGLTLILNDMEFSARMFALAAAQPTRPPEQVRDTHASAETRVRELWQLEPILRRGATVAHFEPNSQDDSEATKVGLFEAGIVTYGRCFNSGLRTRLSADIFVGKLSAARPLHEAVIGVRNRHIAHSELKMERSIVSCQLVEDKAYGARPSAVMSTIAIRRHFPTNERLLELQTHCNAIVDHAVLPRLLESARALREQLLQMPAEQIAAFRDLAAEPPDVDELL